VRKSLKNKTKKTRSKHNAAISIFDENI